MSGVHNGESKQLLAPTSGPGSSGGSNRNHTSSNGGTDDDIIKDVWADDLDAVFELISANLDKYNYVAMDTEFPGVVARPTNFTRQQDYRYQTLKVNVDLLKIIQLGVTFCDKNGKVMPGTCTYQFNFKFNLHEDMYAQDSIDLLKKSGIDFDAFEKRGIDVEDFGEKLMESGLVLNPDVRWISFHSGYDYGYLIKILTNEELPKEEEDFFDLLHLYFPHVYDNKFMMQATNDLRGGLQKLADQLQVDRIGPQHQAGSDSLLTAATFFKMKLDYFSEDFEDSQFKGILYGLGEHPPPKDPIVKRIWD